jgi:AcrR family transcriptional regulator
MDARHSKRQQPNRSRLASARERIDRTAYELFSQQGIRAVGVDTIVARSGVAKQTLYRHYPSKEELALAFLRRREELWTRTWLQREVERRGRKPAEKLLAVFDVFDNWFHRFDFEGCSFIKALLEHGEREHPVRIAAEAHIETIRAYLRHLVQDAGFSDADGFARQWQMIMIGSIIAAYAGDKNAARRGKQIGRFLLACAEDSPRKTPPQHD